MGADICARRTHSNCCNGEVYILKIPVCQIVYLDSPSFCQMHSTCVGALVGIWQSRSKRSPRADLTFRLCIMLQVGGLLRDWQAGSQLAKVAVPMLLLEGSSLTWRRSIPS